MYLLVSDIHGDLEPFEKVVNEWNPLEEKLVFLGDAINRGKNSLEVIQLLLRLHKEHPDKVITLRGNHDNEWLKWLSRPELADIYYWEYFDETIKSFIQPLLIKGINKPTTHQEEALLVNKYYQEEIEFMKTWAYYAETNHCIFVHAGYNLLLEDWRKSKLDDFLWIRDDFFRASIPAPKKTFFGHTPTKMLHCSKNNYGIWTSEDSTKIGVDGGSVFGGQLNAIRIDSKGDILQTFTFKKSLLMGI